METPASQTSARFAAQALPCAAFADGGSSPGLEKKGGDASTKTHELDKADTKQKARFLRLFGMPRPPGLASVGARQGFRRDRWGHQEIPSSWLLTSAGRIKDRPCKIVWRSLDESITNQ